MEGWHGKLKRNIKSEMKASYSLKGGLLAVLEALDDYLLNAKKKAFRATGFDTPLVARLPAWSFHKLPLSIQEKILEQIAYADERIRRGVILTHRVIIPGFNPLPHTGLPEQPAQPVPQLADMPQCNCHWFEAWQLPCQHIWHHHLLYGSLSPQHFHQLFSLWEENGYEIYEEIRRPFAEALDDIIGLPRKMQLDFHEIRDGVNRVQYALQRFAQENPDDPDLVEMATEEVREGMP